MHAYLFVHSALGDELLGILNVQLEPSKHAGLDVLVPLRFAREVLLQACKQTTSVLTVHQQRLHAVSAHDAPAPCFRLMSGRSTARAPKVYLGAAEEGIPLAAVKRHNLQ